MRKVLLLGVALAVVQGLAAVESHEDSAASLQAADVLLFNWSSGQMIVSNKTADCHFRKLRCAWRLTIDEDEWSSGEFDLDVLNARRTTKVAVPYRRLPSYFSPVGYGVKRMTLTMKDSGRALASRTFVCPGKPQLFPPTPERHRYAGKFLSKPYLQNVGTNAFTVCIETRQADHGLFLKWGLKGSGASGRVPFRFKPADFSGTFLATARVEGLPEGAACWFEVEGQRGEVKTWKTCSDDFKCAIFGDFQSGISNGIKWWDWEEDPFLCGERMFEDMIASGCEFAVSTGDMADTGDYRKELRPLVVERTCSVLGAKIPFFTAFGNHDTLHPENHFFFENPSESSFAFFKNNCLFVCIDDAEVGTDKAPGSVKMRDWFEGLMQSEAARKAKFRFVFQHVPVYVEAFGNCNRWLSDLFEKYGVDCVFSGDHHGYERIVRGKLRQVVNGCMGYFDHGSEDVSKLVNWYGEETVAGGHVGMPTPCTWRFQEPGKPGVLGPPTPVYEGMLPGYATLEVKGDTATWTLIGFNADGSKIGPVDSFTMKSGERPDAPKGIALERYCHCRSPKGNWLLKYTLTGKGGRTVVRCEDDTFCKSRPLIEGDVVGVELLTADGWRKTCRLLPDNTVSETGPERVP